MMRRPRATRPQTTTRARARLGLSFRRGLALSRGIGRGSSCGLVLVLTLGAAGCKRDGRPLGREAPVKLSLEFGEPASGNASPVLEVLSRELTVHAKRLAEDDLEVAAYYVGYDLVDVEELWLEAHEGAIVKSSIDRERLLDVDVRVGSAQLDNSHGEPGYAGGLGSGVQVSLDDADLPLAQALWRITEEQYQDAVVAFRDAETEESMMTREDELPHPDFSTEAPLELLMPPAHLDLEAVRTRMEPAVLAASTELAVDPKILDSAVVVLADASTHHFVNSDGTRIQNGSTHLRVLVGAQTKADDGMTLQRFRTFDVHTPEQLPSREELVAAATKIREELLALRKAPLAEPYTGPAVLEGPAAGVFFHEIFGHRLEGHRQKSDDEGQTFAKMLGREVLPTFLDVVDDPTAIRMDGRPLAGHYLVDDEGVKAQRTVIVDDGRLETFLLGRSPVLPFEVSNGHGRRQPGHAAVARQGNLMITSTRTMPEGKLRDALIAEAKRQGKPYGLWFADIQGGYTTTDRGGPQAFKVMPLVVYRVWTDGRPDELVRGADIVGTPLAAFETIVATGDRMGVFNGVCGAESGWVPVSASSPSLLLSKLEIEKAVHEREKPPLLPSPPTRGGGSSTASSTGSGSASGTKSSTAPATDGGVR